MRELMQPRQTLLDCDCARNEARSLSNKLEYDFFDPLEDGSLRIAASEEKDNRPAAGGSNALCMAVVEHVEKPQPQQLRIPALCLQPARRVIVASNSSKSSSDRGLDQVRARMV
jgi:hypothetical protein